MRKENVTSDAHTWDLNFKQLELAEDEVHVWCAHQDYDAIELRQIEETLSADEKARASRFAFERDRNRYIATRGILRELLGRYVNRAPAQLAFDYGPQGKPVLRAEAGGRPVQFNVSHSERVALLAFSVGRRLGIDVELIREIAGEQIAEHYFSPQEVAELNSLPASLQDEGFFLCWTRKEAYIKARGEGLHIPLKSFHVSLTPGAPVRLEAPDGAQWSLHSIHPEGRYVGALVAEGGGWRLRCGHWVPAATP